MSAPICDYCGKPATLRRSSAFLYRGRDYGPVWYCPCVPAWVGCHKGTEEPLGRLADAELRKAKQAAHRAFDPFWLAIKPRKAARVNAYAWLARALCLSRENCHIGMFDVATCKRVVLLCRERKTALTNETGAVASETSA